jgi:DNA repair exonuclease SbcCD ATPase subunit
MIQIKKLELEGFRSFRGKTVIKFPDSGLVLISGKWIDSDVSSGSGKSSIILAIAFALDICDLPASELKNWDSKKLFVKLTLSDGQNTYDIVRDPSLSFYVNNVKQSNMTEDAKEKINALLKVSPDLLKVLTYKPQREKGQFLNMTDSQAKEFLSSVLNLNAIEQAIEQIETKIKNTEITFSQINGSYEVVSNFVQSFNISKEEITKARQIYDEAKKRFEAVSSEPKLTIQNLKEKLNQINEEINKVLQVRQKVDSAKYETTILNKQIEQLKVEVNKLKEQVCYTCLRQWDKSQELLDKKLSEIKVLEHKVQVNEAIIKNSAPILENYSVLQAQQAELNKQIGELNSTITSAQLALQSAEQNCKNIALQVEKYKENLSKLETLKQQKITLENELNILNHEKNILGRQGFLGVIFDEVLAEIENKANELICYFPNISTYSVQISSTTQTKTKNLKKTLSKKVYKDGKEVSIKSLSGGQQAALELCVDLAVSETIRARTGTNLGWIILDEALEGLGAVEKQSALDMLKQKIKGTVLVIDHSTEVKEGFDKIINIMFDGRTSHVI